MSFVCVICDDFLTGDGDGGPPNSIVTTTCGHVYHQKCIHDWFEAKLRNNAREENHGRQLDNSKKCPTCQMNTSLEELIRIFPTEEIEDSEQLNSSGETEVTNPKTRAKLLAENKELREELKRLQTCRKQEEQNWVALFEDMRVAIEESEAKILDLQRQLGTQRQSRGTTTTQELSTLVEEETPNELTTAISSVPVQRSRNIRNSLSVRPLETTMGGLKCGDMVVWPSPEVPEENHNGSVTWIGIVDNVIFAAVLCDDPIGNTNGVINEKLRFECNPEYTRLIPVRELILKEDFYPPTVDRGAGISNAAAAVPVE